MAICFRSWALLGAVAVPALAQADALGLDEAIRYALNHNAELRVTEARAAAADARASAAKGAFLPQLGLRYLARRSDNPLDAFADKLNTRSVNPATDFTSQALNQPDPSTLRATQLSLELPLYTGGRLVAGLREAGAQAEAAELTRDYRRQQVAFETLRTYRNAQAAAFGVQIAADAVDAARGHAETTASLVRQGRIVPSDRLTAELNLSSTRSMQEQAESRLRQAIEDLRFVAGLPADRDIQLPAWEPTPVGAAPATGDETQALANRPDLKARVAEQRAARARVTAARSAFQPQIGLVATDSWYDDQAALNNRSQSVMGVVSLNLFNGGRDWHGVGAAQRDAEQADVQAEAARLGAVREVRVARAHLREALARRDIAAQSVDKARETVRLVKQRYGEGRTILIDLLMAERVLVEARNEELNAGLQSELAAAELQLAEGVLPLPGDAPAR